MRDFWSENKKIIGKLLLNQFGATFFGIMLVMPAYAAKSQKDWLMLVTSCFSVFFYVFLIYSVMWERGGQDRIKVDGGRAVMKPLTGLWVSLIANIPNFIISAIILISNPLKTTFDWATSMNSIGRGASLIWEGMYAGIVSYFSPFNPIIHLLIIIPALLTSVGGYLLGMNNRRILSAFELKQPKNK